MMLHSFFDHISLSSAASTSDCQSFYLFCRTAVVASGLGFCKHTDLITALDRSAYATCMARCIWAMSRSPSNSPTVSAPVFSHSLGLLVIPVGNYMTTLYLVILKGQSNENHIVTLVTDVINDLMCLLWSVSKWMLTSKPATQCTEIVPRLRAVEHTITGVLEQNLQASENCFE